MSNKKREFIKMYSEFRKELDTMCIPLIYEESEKVEFIKLDGKTVGVVSGSPWYIDCVYIMSEYRHKGLAAAAVKKYVGRCPRGIRLHIINNNTAALKFWNALFELHTVDENKVDTLYEIVRAKEKGERK